MESGNPVGTLLSVSRFETELAQTRVAAEDVKRSGPGFILEFRADRTADRLHVISFAALL